jgi:hypothetical protein
MALAESMREVQNEQAGVAQAQQVRELDQAAQALEREYPQLATEEGVNQMLGSAAALLEFEGSRDELLDLLANHPDGMTVIRDAMEYQSGGEGQFLKMWQAQQDPGNKFWGTGGASSGGIA